jgi:electron transfer flavoprotein-quinone oxidoreductase
MQKIQERTGLLSYLEDEEYSHIRVNYPKANLDKRKLWVPACPVNCYTLVVPGKGVFASYKDLYYRNLSVLAEKLPSASSKEVADEAVKETWKDVEKGEIRFDHVPCISCGTCWLIGPPDVIDFNPERDGHGVKFRYG